MPDRLDARVPVRLAGGLDGTVAEGTLVLVEHGLDLTLFRAAPVLRAAVFAPPHDAAGAVGLACPCCVGRAPFASELGALFQERARGTLPFFLAVLAIGSPCGLARAHAALSSDPFLVARYRFVGLVIK